MRTTNFVPSTLVLIALTTACAQENLGQEAGVTTFTPAPSATATTAPTAAPSAPNTVPVISTAPAELPDPLVAPTPQDQLPPLFANPVQTAHAVPIAGGTLLVTADGATAVAADPDRDSVFLVDLTTHAVRSVKTQPGDEVGRVVEGPAGTVFVAARRGGAVLALDLASGGVSRFPVCNAPRGLAYDAASNHLYVACQSGRLATLDATTGAVVSTLDLDTDLRDVLLVGGSLVVTRFRSAEVLRLDASGAVALRLTPPVLGVNTPGVAYRAVAVSNTIVALSHEVESSAQLGTGFGAYYGGGCGGGGVVEQVLSLVAVDGSSVPHATSGTVAVTGSNSVSVASTLLGGATGPLDVAVSRDSSRLAVVATGNSWAIKQPSQPNLYLGSLDLAGNGVDPQIGQGNCGISSNTSPAPTTELVAVAFDANGHYVLQSREPAELVFESGASVSLSAESHFDTGFASFHVNAGGGIACASCHPEGGEDGHVWSFAQVGLRRSQPLEANVGARTPFHWTGDLPTFRDLFGEVMIKRMSLPVVPSMDDVNALESWLDTVPALAPADGLDASVVAHGKELFASAGCTTCHDGAQYTDNLKHDVGTGGAFVTPSLLGVGLRAPLMHDGCASTLAARFGICGGTNHGNVTGLASADIDALVAFMRSL